MWVLANNPVFIDGRGVCVFDLKDFTAGDEYIVMTGLCMNKEFVRRSS